MAQKRMFSNAVVMSDCFLDMPNSAKFLYFILNMNADDDGFITSPKAIMRMANCNEDDFKILVVKNYLITFVSGVVLITHWKINNAIQKDRYKTTTCIERDLVGIRESGEYYLLQDEVSKVETSSVEVIQESNNDDVKEIEEEYKQKYQELYNKGLVKTKEPIINWIVCRKNLKDAIERFGPDNIKLSLELAMNDNFCLEKGYSLSIILSAGVLSNLLNNKKIVKETEEKKLESVIKKHPKTCKCGNELEDCSGGYGSMWFCRNCETEYELIDGQWVEK